MYIKGNVAVPLITDIVPGDRFNFVLLTLHFNDDDIDDDDDDTFKLLQLSTNNNNNDNNIINNIILYQYNINTISIQDQYNINKQ